MRGDAEGAGDATRAAVIGVTDYAAERLTKKYGPVAAVESAASATALKVHYAVHRTTTGGTGAAEHRNFSIIRKGSE